MGRAGQSEPEAARDAAEAAPEVARPAPETIVALTLPAPDVADEVLAGHEPEGAPDPPRQRIGPVFQRVVRVAARDGAPVAVVKRPAVSAPRCPVVADEGGWLEANVPPGAHDAEAEIGLLEIVGELLVEAADLEEYVAPEGAVAAGDASYPPRRVAGRLALWWGLAEQLEAVIRRRTPGELAVIAVPRIDGATAGAEPLILRERSDNPVEPV